MTSLTSGTRLGPYAIGARLGEGGMGVVWRATDTRLARFEREAKVLASLNHPGIAAIYGLEEGEGTVALVMEVVPGEDLAQRLARGPIPLEETLPLASRIAEAVVKNWTASLGEDP